MQPIKITYRSHLKKKNKRKDEKQIKEDKWNIQNYARRYRKEMTRERIHENPIK